MSFEDPTGMCECVCHAGADGRWRVHVCEHCAPGYVRRRRAREQENFVRRDKAQTTPQTTPNKAGASAGHSAEQGALA